MRKYLLGLLILNMCMCSKTASEPVIIGKCCGMCEGKCFNGFVVYPEKVYAISGKYCDNYDTAGKKLLNAAESAKVREVVKALPPGFGKYKGRIGCPDCHDQCGIFLKHNNEGVIIDPDPGSHPVELTPFITKLNELSLL